MEDCMSCGKSFPLSSLKDHIKNCEMQDSRYRLRCIIRVRAQIYYSFINFDFWY